MPLFRRKPTGGRLVKDLTEILEKADSLAKTDQESAILYYRRVLREVVEEEGNLTPEIRPDVSRILTKAGIALYKLGEADAALECFEKAKEVDPRNAQAWFYIGRDLIRKGVQLPYAIICLKEAAKLVPNRGEIWIYIGDGYRLQGKEDMALQAYKKAIEINPNLIEAYQKILNLEPDNVEALHKLYEILRENPKKDEDLYVQVLLKLAEIENDIRYLDEGIEKLPNNVALLVRKAYFLKSAGRYQEAYEAIEEGLKIDPKNEDLQVLKMSLEELIGKEGKEVAVGLPSLGEVAPKTPTVERERGEVPAEQPSKPEEVEEEFGADIFGELNLQRKSSIPITLGEGAEIAEIPVQKEEKPTEEIKRVEEVKEAPKPTAGMDEIRREAMELYKNGNYKEALNKFLQLLDAGENGELSYYIGMCYYHLDEYEMAEAHFRNVYDKWKDDEEFLYAFAVTLLNNDKYDDALREVDALLQKDRGNKRYLVLKATVLYSKGNLDEANNILTEILKVDMKNADAYYHKARIMAIKGVEMAVKNFLMMAIKFDKEYKDAAKEDPYFEKYRDKDWFKKLVS